MEFTDQNKVSRKSKSKIPVLKKSVTKELRQPLKTLLDLDSNVVNTNVQHGISEKKKGLRKSNSFSVADTRFVTVLRSEVNGFSVFNDNDDKENSTNKKELTPSTFAKNRLKNIKKSLKRPHSRELQGVASITKSVSFTEEVPIQKQISVDSTAKSHVSQYACDATCHRVYGMDIFTYLLEKEERTPYPTFLLMIKKRAFALNWLVDINSTGDPAVIQTAAWYFDMVLTKRRLKLNDLPVAITACFWISRKVHGKVCTARALVEKSGSVFDTEHLCTVEKRILNLLNIPRQPVVPQEFIAYLAWWCNNENPEEIVTSASFICLSAITLNLDMCNEYPSVIAAAAIRTALLLLKKQHLAEKLKGCFVYQAAIMKDDIIEVCIAQIEALKMLFTDDFEFTATKKLFKNDLGTLEKLNYELNYLYHTGGEGIVRAFLML